MKIYAIVLKGYFNLFKAVVADDNCIWRVTSVYTYTFMPSCFRSIILRLGLLIALTTTLSACSQGLFVGDINDSQKEIQRLQSRLVNNPSDSDALRDLGIIYLNARKFAEANNYLEQAFSVDPDDAGTLYHLGLANETVAKRETALRLYEKYVTVSRANRYRRKMEGRYKWLSQRILRENMKALAQAPVETDRATSPRIVAVYPFIYHGVEERYAPLARGLAELVSVDLANVSAIRVVERVRLQALLDELEISQSEYMDASTAPRVGKLLGAGRLVSGGYNVLDGSSLRLDGAFTEIESASIYNLSEQADALRNLFAMEKAFVFDLIKELGIQLSPEERQQIEYIPTENLQAFLAYSRGLREEDGGAYGLAAGFYRRASQLDPNFSEATLRAEEAEAMADADKSIEEMIAEGTENDSPQSGNIDLMALRIGLLNEAIGSGVVPGEDARKPASESGTGVGLLGDPPKPPNPRQ